MGGFFFKKMPLRKKVDYQYYQEECLLDKNKIILFLERTDYSEKLGWYTKEKSYFSKGRAFSKRKVDYTDSVC